MEKKNSRKVIKKPVKQDLVGIALVHLASESNKKIEEYKEALLDHVSKGKSREFRDNAENYVYDVIYGDTSYEEFKEIISKFRKTRK